MSEEEKEVELVEESVETESVETEEAPEVEAEQKQKLRSQLNIKKELMS